MPKVGQLMFWWEKLKYFSKTVWSYIDDTISSLKKNVKGMINTEGVLRIEV